jgi:CHAT domain-containing protein
MSFDRLAHLVAGLLALTASASAYAATEPPPGKTAPTQTSLTTRFYDLLLRDKNTDSEGSQKLWQALIADAETDPTFPKAMLIQSYGWLAWAQANTADAAKAEATALAGEKIAIANGVADTLANADLLSITALIETSNGKTEASMRDGQAALDLAKKHSAGESAEIAFANFALGDVAYTLGKFIDSERFYAAASDQMAKTMRSDDTRIVTAMTTHAATLYHVGRVEDALTEGERSVNWSLVNLPEENPATTLALSNLSSLLRYTGRLQESEILLRRVLDRQERYQRDDWSARAAQLSNFAAVIDRQGRHLEAEVLWLKAREWFLKEYDEADPILPAGPFRHAADAAQSRGDLKTAIARRKAAIAAVEQHVPAEHPILAQLKMEFAGTWARMGNFNNALKIASPQIAIIRANLPTDSVDRIRFEIAYAKIVARATNSESGYRIAEPIAQILENKLLDTSTARGDLVHYGPMLSSTFATFADLAFGSGHNEDGFRALQLANLSDIVLVNADLAGRVASATPATAALVQDLQDHIRQRQVLDGQRSYAAAAQEANETKRIAELIVLNDAKIAGLTSEIDRVFPDYRALTRPTPVKLADYISNLHPGEILLAPVPVDDGTLAVSVTRDGLVWQRTPYSYSRIAELTSRIRISIDAAARREGAPTNFDESAAAQLYQAIIPPTVAPSFKAHPHLLFFASGNLAKVPPALLIEKQLQKTARPSETAWLVRTHDTLIVPTLSIRKTAMLPQARVARFLGVGAPSLGDVQSSTSRGLPFRSGSVDASALRRLPSLPNAELELREIGSELGGKQQDILTGREADEANIKSMPLDQYSVIAFATHGLMSGDFAGLTEPALVLSPPSHPSPENDGMLTTSEIAALHLNADWVILSACNSAGSAGSGNPAYSGLASAFVKAGARSLLVSHWPIRDDAAKLLTVTTVRNARTSPSRAVALQQAMLTLLEDKSIPQAGHPAIWASFVLIGR